MSFATFWQQLNPRARIATAVGAAAIVAGTVAGIAWVLAPRYEVLFSDLAPEDAAVMTAELDRMKTPYRLSDDGSAILVTSEAVHKTRLKLVSKNLPLHGAVGFELFNGGDFGMTDFAQKVNFQRALQGEIARTILSIEGIQSARVILALPERQLFRERDSQPKASINLVLKAGQVLSHEQVMGIARLVSAAVPDIAMQNVTIVDQHGIALTRAGAIDGTGDGEGAGAGALELKKSTEAYLARKLNDVLNQTFGPGKAIARVDVTLDLSRVQRTREQLLPSAKDAAAGVLVRERSEGEGDGSGTVSLPPLPGSEAAAGGAARREREYQVGRDVEQTVSMPGAIRRMAIATVVNDTIDAAQLAHLKEVLAATAGYDAARGDTIAVYPFGQVAQSARSDQALGVGDAALATTAVAGPPSSAGDPGMRKSRMASANDLVVRRILPALAGIIVILAFVVAFVHLWRRPRKAAVPDLMHPLAADERNLMLSDMQRWIASDVSRSAQQ